MVPKYPCGRCRNCQYYCNNDNYTSLETISHTVSAEVSFSMRFRVVICVGSDTAYVFTRTQHHGNWCFSFLPYPGSRSHAHHRDIRGLLI